MGSLKEFGMVPTPMVRPDLRRDMVVVPKISGPQEKERDVEYPEGTSSPQGSTVPGGFPGMGASRDLALGFQGNERDHSSACKKVSPRERTLRENWPVVDGSWRRAGVEELPCELVREWHFLESGVPAKQLRSRKKGMGVEREKEGWGGGGRPGEQGQC
jgi:hypothetical protein